MLIFWAKVVLGGIWLYVAIMHPELRPIQAKKWGIRKGPKGRKTNNSYNETC